jgi:YVTN family beta-propeller protein
LLPSSRVRTALRPTLAALCLVLCMAGPSSAQSFAAGAAVGVAGGPGRLADLVAATRASGILWITAAGNYRQVHWNGGFVDRDRDGFHDFPAGGLVNCFGSAGYCDAIPGGLEFEVTMRWSDWDRADQDFDLYVARWNGSLWEAAFESTDIQSGQPGQRPVERIVGRTYGAPTVYGVAIARYQGNRAVNLDVVVRGARELEQNVTARSVASPGDADGAITVAAVDRLSPFSQKSYSSEGPTNGSGGVAGGGRRKPDISAFAGVSTVSINAFEGTSAATPHVSGAAALARGAYPDWTVDQVEQLLLDRAIDMGPSGPDNRFGRGRLHLGAPPATASPTATAIPSNTATHRPSPTATRTASVPPPSATRTRTPSLRPTGTPTVTPPHTPTRSQTPSRSSTPSATPIPTETRTPAATPTRGPCYGDCDGNGRLTIDEVVTAVSLALGMTSLDRCPMADTDGNGLVSIAEIVRVVNATLFGCIAAHTATATPSEPIATPTLAPTALDTATAAAPPTVTPTVTPPDLPPTATPTPTRASESGPFFRALVTNTDSDTVTVIDLDDRRVVTTIGGFAAPHSVAGGADGASAYVTNEASGTMAVVDALTSSVIDEVVVGDSPGPIAITPDGTTVLIGTENGGGALVFVDRGTAQIAAEVPLDGRPLSIAVSPAAAKAYVGVGAAIEIVDLVARMVVDQILLPGTSEATDIEFIPSGALALAASRPDNVLYIVDGEEDAGWSSLPLGSGGGGAAGIGDIPFTTLMIAAQSTQRELTMIDRERRSVVAHIPVTGEPVDVAARTSFFAFAPLRDPAGGAGLLAVINTVTRVLEATIGPPRPGVPQTQRLELVLVHTAPRVVRPSGLTNGTQFI